MDACDGFLDRSIGDERAIEKESPIKESVDASKIVLHNADRFTAVFKTF
jgi:hypothetical protein